MALEDETTTLFRNVGNQLFNYEASHPIIKRIPELHEKPKIRISRILPPEEIPGQKCQDKRHSFDSQRLQNSNTKGRPIRKVKVRFPP